MYAVIETGGKQYRVKEGDRVRIEKLGAEAGAAVEFDQVLMVGEGDKVKVGTPYVKGGKVTAEVDHNGRGPKISIIKLKRRKHHRKRQGHRQDYTEVRITGIKGGGGSKTAEGSKATEGGKAAKASGTRASGTKASGTKASGGKAGSKASGTKTGSSK